VPDFFIIGMPKSGTSAMYEALRSHPQIFMPELKEPVFFAAELPRQAHRYRAPATMAEYLELFAPAREGQVVGEASASYLWSRGAAEAIARHRPDARMIAILREPASFLRSFHLQCVQSRNETEKDLATALALEPARREGHAIPRRSSWPALLLYSDQVRYVEQLRRYRKHFPPEQLLILIYDDFREDNANTMTDVLGFLGVAQDAPIELGEANPSVRMRSQHLDEMVNSLAVGRGGMASTVNTMVKAAVPRGVRRAALKEVQRRFVATEPDPPDPALVLEIRRRYRDEVASLSEFLDRDLITLWGYDSIS
jgi:hypothetical protein